MYEIRKSVQTGPKENSKNVCVGFSVFSLGNFCGEEILLYEKPKCQIAACVGH